MFWDSPSKRWTKPFLTKYLEPREHVSASVGAFTGILGHRFINSMPVMWGSTLWDFAITDQRILAIERPMLGFWKKSRKQISIAFARIVRIETQPRWRMETMLYVTTADGKTQRFKLGGWPRELKDVNEKLAQLQQAIRTGVPHSISTDR